MLISSKGRYAIRVMLYLAPEMSGEFIPLSRIAESEKISVKYLEAIVAILNKAGFLDSRRGKDGGYRLSKRPEEYNIGEIIRAAEGDITPVSCLDCGPGGCSASNDCLSKHLWIELETMFNEYFESITLKDVLERNTKKTQKAL